MPRECLEDCGGHGAGSHLERGPVLHERRHELSDPLVLRARLGSGQLIERSIRLNDRIDGIPMNERLAESPQICALTSATTMAAASTAGFAMSTDTPSEQ